MSLAKYMRINNPNDDMNKVMKGLTNEQILNDINNSDESDTQVKANCDYNREDIERMNNRNNMNRPNRDMSNYMNNMNSSDMVGLMDSIADMKENCMNNMVNMIDTMIANGNLVSRNDLMIAIMKYQLATLDIALFLDTHPNDPVAIKKHQEFCMKLDSYKKIFTVLYGPMDLYTCDNSGSWRYNEGPWPWKQEF